jgi:UrcA family protein
MRSFIFETPARLLSICGAVAAVALAGLVAPPALAADRPLVVASPDIVTRNITYADLDLASAAGEATLNRRVRGAIRSLCSEANGHATSHWYVAHDCSMTAWNQVAPQIDRAVRQARDLALTGSAPTVGAAVAIDLSK